MEQLIDVASRFFDLGGWHLAARLGGGILNEVYLIETSHSHYILKVNRVRQSKSLRDNQDDAVPEGGLSSTILIRQRVQ